MENDFFSTNNGSNTKTSSELNSSKVADNANIQRSAYETYSIGQVASNKDNEESLLDPFIEVVPLEVRKFSSGDLTDNATTLESSGTTALGSEYASSVHMTSSLRAKWLGEGQSNRLTAPNVRRGEKVMIYRLGKDNPTYFWDTLENHIRERRLETVIWAFSGESDINKPSSIENNNCYWLQISTHEKNIVLQTSKANGEPFAYSFQLDTNVGEWLVTDDDKNYFKITSKTRNLEMGNGDGTFIRLNGPDIQMYAPGNMETLVDGNTKTTVKGSSEVSTSGDVTGNTGGSFSQTTSGENTLTSNGSTAINGASGASINAPNIGLMGNVSSGAGSYGGTGKLELSGDSTYLDNMTIMGDLKVNGNTDVRGVLSSINLNVDNPPW